jgi:glycosyltransferase involved in cell wall biosynthesis
MLDPWFKHTYPLKHLKKWLYWPWAEYRVLRDATAVLFTCESERRLARQSFWLYQCDEFVVNYGTAPPPGNVEAERAAFLARFPHLADKRCLLFLGRIHVKKGVDLAIRAFANKVKQMSAEEAQKLHLVIAGPDDNEYASEMKSLAKSLGVQDSITWTGMLVGEMKWGAFRTAEAFILPSHQENFGISVAESLACGVPVLISNQVNIWLEIQQANAGYVETDNFAGATVLIERWISTPPAVWNQMRKNAVNVFAERFQIERTAQSFIRAMQIFGLHDTTTMGADTTSAPPK